MKDLVKRIGGMLHSNSPDYGPKDPGKRDLLIKGGAALVLGGLLVYFGGACKRIEEFFPEENHKPPGIEEPTEIVEDEQPSLESRIYEKLLVEVPEIKVFDNEQQRRVIDQTVFQIRDDIYGNNLDKEEKAWEYINKGINIVLPGLKKADLSNYSDMDLRQILLPPSLRSINIKSILEGNRDIQYDHIGLGYGLENVTSDESLGMKSPLQEFTERVRGFYNDKNSLDYVEAIRKSTGAARRAWPNSMGSFQEIREEMLSRGEDAPLFIIGWSRYIVGEQNSPSFSPLVGRVMEQPLAAYWTNANYPIGTAKHTEPLVSYQGELIGAWMNEAEFLKDYQLSTRPDLKGKINDQSEMNEPIITLAGPDRKGYNPFTLKPINQ